MIRQIVLCLVLALALSAPSGDKMTHIPVKFLPIRDILMTTIPASILAILMSKILIDLFIMSLFNLQMDLATKIQLLYG